MEIMGGFIKVKNDFFYSSSQINNDISNLIGNKSYNTFLLSSKGFNVPQSVFLSTKLFDIYTSNDTANFDKIIISLKKYLYSNDFSNSLAIRSSAILFDNTERIIKEDSETLSMAGWFKSNLNVPINNIKDAIIDCYSIIKSNILKKNIENHFHTHLTIKIALLIQNFYEATKSAVIFTKNQYSYNRGSFLINSTYGACNGLVSGEITGDTYWLNRDDSLIIEKHISKKDKMYINNSKDIILVEVPQDIQNKESLSSTDIKNLFDLGISIENAFNFPQDIELIYNLNKGWVVVQTRPINYWRDDNDLSRQSN